MFIFRLFLLLIMLHKDRNDLNNFILLMTRQLRNEFKNFADFSDGAATAFVRRRVSVEQHFNAHCKGLSHSGENVGARGLRGKRSQMGLLGEVFASRFA